MQHVEKVFDFRIHKIRLSKFNSILFDENLKKKIYIFDKQGKTITQRQLDFLL